MILNLEHPVSRRACVDARHVATSGDITFIGNIIDVQLNAPAPGRVLQQSAREAGWRQEKIAKTITGHAICVPETASNSQTFYNTF